MREVDSRRRSIASVDGVRLLAGSLLMVLAAFSGNAPAVEMSRGIQDLNLSYEECLGRAYESFVAEGYRTNRSQGEGFVTGFKNNVGAYINCTGLQPRRMSVIVMVATEGVPDTSLAGSERVRLMQRMGGNVPPPPPQATQPPPPPMATQPPSSPPPAAIPVTWYTTAKSDTPDGTQLSFSCPPIRPDGFMSIWGTDVYTWDSGICMAGVHVGVITRERGGVVTIQMRPGQASYPATFRNGFSSQAFGPYGKSFAVLTSASSRVTGGQPQIAGCTGFNGSWASDYGPMQLTVQGNRVTGSYPNHGGRIDATVSGSVLEGRWIQTSRQGRLRFTLSSDGKRFSGIWGYDDKIDGGSWNGTCGR